MADGGYANCAVQLLESVRGAGRWGGPLLVLVPTGSGTIPLPDSSVARLHELNASLLEVAPEAAGGSNIRGAGSATQYAKVQLLTDPDFRKYDSILYLDADGVVGAPLEPLIKLAIPDGRVVALPTWPTTAVKHDGLFAREIDFSTLTPQLADDLRSTYPDRSLVGITAWFMLKPTRLPEPEAMRQTVDKALDRWRAAFRFNDQGLWNVLFYHTAAFFPLCISGPLRSDATSVPAEFQPLLVDSLDGLGRAIESACGPSIARRKKMYDHPVNTASRMRNGNGR